MFPILHVGMVGSTVGYPLTLREGRGVGGPSLPDGCRHSIFSPLEGLPWPTLPSKTAQELGVVMQDMPSCSGRSEFCVPTDSFDAKPHQKPLPTLLFQPPFSIPRFTKTRIQPTCVIPFISLISLLLNQEEGR